MTCGLEKQFDREVALPKAIELLWAHGYKATNLSELLKTIGIGKKSLYDTLAQNFD